jgi:CubicO group peptidase (beta-lactamase class C family)
MYKKLVVTISLLGSLGCFFGNSALASDLDDLVIKALDDRSVPAMTALTIHDGKIAEQVVHGVRAAGSNDPARLSDQWHIGSDTKAMTATMIARLVERGTLSWTTQLKDMLPLISMLPQYQDVTLVELLSHRAGLPPQINEKLIEAAREDKRPLAIQRQEYAKLALNEAPVGPSRAAMNYSNSGFMVAACIAELATGKSYEDLMQEEIFVPLEIEVNTGNSKPGEVLGHEAGKPLSGEKSDIPAYFAPAGATMKLSMGDWAKFAIDQMAGEHGNGKLLKTTSYTFLHTQQGDTSSALGWGVRTGWPANAPIRLLMHAGSNGYWNALIALAPDSMSAILVAANAGEGSSAENAEANIIKTLLPIIVNTK